jgi:hypothetical protein
MVKGPFYSLEDGAIIGNLNGRPYCFNQIDTPREWSELQAYLSETKEQILTKPEKTAVQKAEKIKVQLIEIDSKSNRPLRAIVSGTATNSDREYLALLESQAVSLRAELATLQE